MNPTAIIDPNVRVRGNQTYVGFEDLRGAEVKDLSLGQTLDLLEQESGMYGSGSITDIDTDKELIFLAVQWSELRLPRNYEVSD